MKFWSASIWRVPFAVSVPAALIGAMMLRGGILATADSWALWEGSVSLLEQGRYTYFGGEPISAFPPLYSALLALWQSAFGVSGRSLILLHAVLLFLNSLLWSAFGMRVLSKCARLPWLPAAGAAFAVAFILSTQIFLLASSLQLVFLAAAANVLAAHGVIPAAHPLRQGALLGLCTGLALLAHNSSMAFVAGAIAVLISDTRIRFSKRVLPSLVILSIAVLPWLLVRTGFGQLDSHVLGTGAGRYHPQDYLAHIAHGTGTFFVPEAAEALRPLFLPVLALLLTAAAYAMRARRAPSPSGIGSRPAFSGLAIFAFTSLAMLFAMFNVVWISDKMDGRFLWCFPLLLAPVLLRWLVDGPRWILAAVLLLLLTTPLLRVGRYTALGAAESFLGPRRDAHDAIEAHYFITASNRAPADPSLKPIDTPEFPYMENFRFPHRTR